MSAAAPSSSSSSSPCASASAPQSSILVGIAGATGMVGQRFLALLANHPYFRVVALSASDRSAGKSLKEACEWKLSNNDMPQQYANMQVEATVLETFIDAKCRIVFSALDGDLAFTFENALAAAGLCVFSNAKSHRMDPSVPILIPHANAEHIDIIPHQQKQLGFEKGGFIVTNANCSSTGLVVALKPLLDTFGIEKLFVTTLQAISGAGYPGVSALDITDNVIPYISGEEDKMQMEPQKILGTFDKVSSSGHYEFIPAHFAVSAQCNRVATIDGHMECVSVKLSKPATVEQVEECMKQWKSEAQTLQLPSAPKNPLFVHSSPTLNRPQPRYDRDREGGMVVTVGRIRTCPILDFKFALCSHNTILGAAGGSILNAELAVAKGYVK